MKDEHKHLTQSDDGPKYTLAAGVVLVGTSDWWKVLAMVLVVVVVVALHKRCWPLSGCRFCRLVGLLTLLY